MKLPFIASACVLAAARVAAYVTLGSTWPGATIVMHLQLGATPTLMDGATSWDTPAESALGVWNSYMTRSQLTAVRNSSAPIGGANGINNVFWSNSVYGEAFGSTTLAATVWWRSGAITTDADVIFNRALSWNSYGGALLRGSPRVYDIRRVALHEFGHVLGLGHPDESGQVVSAIMNSRISDLDTLTSDDIAGARSLYLSALPTPPSAPAPVPTPVPGPTPLPPGPPSHFSATASGLSVSLAWAAPTTGGTPVSYAIEAGSVAGAANLATFSTAAVTYNTSNVGAGTYYLRVRAINAAGTSAPSNEAILAIGGVSCASAPTAPTGLQTFGGGTTVTLRWSPSGGNPDSYQIEVGSTPGAKNLLDSDLGSPATSLTSQNVGRGTYFVRLRGKNACGTGSASNEVIVTVP